MYDVVESRSVVRAIIKDDKTAEHEPTQQNITKIIERRGRRSRVEVANKR
jgi:hypothetical protein